MRTKRGKLFDKGYLYKLLNNRTYLRLAVHKGAARTMVDQSLWDKVHAMVKALARAFRWRKIWTRVCMGRSRTWPGRRACMPPT